MTHPARFRAACRFLRLSGGLEHGKTKPYLPGQRSGESAIDWMVRIGLAKTPALAAEALIVAAGMEKDWQLAQLLLAESEADASQPTGGAESRQPAVVMNG